MEHGAGAPDRIEIAQSEVVEYQKRADHFRDLLVEGVNVEYETMGWSGEMEIHELIASGKAIILSILVEYIIFANTNDMGALAENIGRRSASK